MKLHFSAREKHLFKVMIIIAAAVIVALRVFVLYYPFQYFGYLVPPNMDAISHLLMVKKIMIGDWDSNYPLLFHAIIAAISKLTTIDPLTVIKGVTPVLVILPPVGVYLFLKKHFGIGPAVIGGLIGLWASNYGLMAFGDGNYPNIIASGFLMTIAFLFIVEATLKKKWTNYFWGIFFVVLIVLTHHLTALFFALICIFYLLACGIWNRYERIAPSFKKVLTYVLVVLGCGAIVIALTPFRQTFVSVFKSVSDQGSFFTDPAFIQPINFGEYGAMAGGLVWYGGLISLIYMIYLLGKPKEEINKPAILLILSWFIVAFILSRLPQTGLPGRFAREVALPLIFSLGITIHYIVQSFKYSWQKVLGYGIFGFIICINLVQVNNGAYGPPEYFNRMIWFSAKDKEITDYINNLPGDGKVLANPISPYMPVFTNNRVIVYAPPTAPTKTEFNQYVKDKKVEYILIGTKTEANPGGTVYPFFKRYDEATTILGKNIGDFKKIETFTNGSVLYQYVPPKTKAKKK